MGSQASKALNQLPVDIRIQRPLELATMIVAHGQ
jgi:hypothetical protein